MVGERGPELFVPPSAGQIVPNGKLGGASTTNINMPLTVNVTASGGSPEQNADLANQIGGKLKDVVDQRVAYALRQQTRPGGMIGR